MLIVTGFDGSPSAAAALRRADLFASSLNADHHVVMVAHVAPIEFAAMANPYQVDMYAIEEERLMEAYTGVQPDLKTEPKLTLVRGNPVLEISAYASEHDADLIVVGSRGRGAVATALLGSTSHGLLWRTQTDVLVVR